MINNITFKNFVNNIQYKNNSANRGYYPKSRLAPLGLDTVSFTSKPHGNKPVARQGGGVEPTKDTKTKTLNTDLMNAFDNLAVCKEVYDNAKFARDYLRKTLNRNLSNFLIKNNPNGSISSIDIRIKSPDSIREKIASQLGAAITADEPFAFNPNKAEEIKVHCTDLIGARIVMAKETKSESGKILKALLKDVESGKLKVNKIEHYIAQNENDTEEYFSAADLKALHNAANKQRASKGLKPIAVETKAKPSGYMALHLDIDLSSSNFKVKENGYHGEIQFIGQDVCQFKELEDLCYKINAGKDIKSGDYSYAPFVKYFKEQMKNPAYPNLKEDFVQYTKKAFLFQKKKKPTNDKSKSQLPSIENCNMEGKIPSGLDFRVLNKIKINCENTSKITKQYTNPAA